ncbi:CotH kinase family protein [bacterium]|nr:CotH kinase family protein [bacterium]MBU1989636.1 CotH kinase family protein [bacterium]
MKRNIRYTLLLISMFLFAACGSPSSSVSDNDSDTQSDVLLTVDDWTEETHSNDVNPNFAEVFSDTEVKRLDIVISSEYWQSMLANMTEMYGEFGSINQNEVPTQNPADGAVLPPPPPGDIPTTNEIPTLLSSDEDPIFVPAEVYYNGIQWYKVGVRFKGNSSLQTAWEQGVLKLSFKLDFDEYEDSYPQIKNQRFYGFKKFSLKNNYDDHALVREKVAADVFRSAGLAVSNTAFYTVYIDHGNGAEYFGLYTLVEEIDDTLIDTQFISGDGNLYKPEEGSATFIEGTFSSDDFEKKTNEDDADYSDIEALFAALHDITRTTDAPTWRANLEAVFDVDTFLKYLAVNGVIQNGDTYGLMAHNYYLYNNPANKKLTWIPWDNNEALQDGKMGGALALDFSNLADESWPLIAKIYADATYKAQYNKYVEDTITAYFNSDNMQSTYTAYASLIEAYAVTEREGFSFLDTTNISIDFENAIDILKTHALTRKTVAQSYLEQ